VRSRRLRLLESLRRTISELLHDRVRKAAAGRGRPEPENTSAIYAMAQSEVPDLLDQLLLVHHRVEQERGEVRQGPTPPPPDDRERKRMLSAVRAMVHRSAERFNGQP
jgi:hypothetical protein